MKKGLLVYTLALALVFGAFAAQAEARPKHKGDCPVAPLPITTLAPPKQVIPSRPPGQSGAWNILYRDEFARSTLSGSGGTTHPGALRSGSWWATDGGGTIEPNNEKQWFRESQLRLNGGRLQIVAELDPTPHVLNGKTLPYMSGQVITGPVPWGSPARAESAFAFQYGYAEARIKLPKGQGLWPALWLLPSNTEWPPEIDIMEFLGHRPGIIEQHFHYRDAQGTDFGPGFGYDPVSPADFSLDFHTFAIDWTPTSIKYFVDGIQTWEFADAAHVPAEPMYLIASMAVGGNWPGDPDETTVFPAVMEVDYLRVWQRA